MCTDGLCGLGTIRLFTEPQPCESATVCQILLNIFISRRGVFMRAAVAAKDPGGFRNNNPDVRIWRGPAPLNLSPSSNDSKNSHTLHNNKRRFPPYPPCFIVTGSQPLSSPNGRQYHVKVKVWIVFSRSLLGLPNNDKLFLLCSMTDVAQKGNNLSFPTLISKALIIMMPQPLARGILLRKVSRDGPDGLLSFSYFKYDTVLLVRTEPMRRSRCVFLILAPDVAGL